MIVHQASCVAIGGRGVLIEGQPGSGKSSLALALIDRGAVLVGDDGVVLEASDGCLHARPHPATEGVIEVRNLGLIRFPACARARIDLVIALTLEAPRFIDAAEGAERAGFMLPLVALAPAGELLALRAELALQHYGLTTG